MGKVIRAQRIGKQKSRMVPSHRYKGKVRHDPLNKDSKPMQGVVTEIYDDIARAAPVAKVQNNDGNTVLRIAPLGLAVGDQVGSSVQGMNNKGSVQSLKNITEGTQIYNIEATPGDGGRFTRAAGTSSTVITRDAKGTVVQLPSGVFKTFNSECRANIGTVAGGGLHEKPFVTAGNKFKAYRARGKLYPWVCGVNMNPTDHPFGGGNHPHTGKPRTISRHAPPGRKIGSIAARRTGKKK